MWLLCTLKVNLSVVDMCDEIGVNVTFVVDTSTKEFKCL